MTDATLMCAALMDGARDDGTISAALDALRADQGMTYLEAVIEIARVHKAHLDAKQMAEAAVMVRSGSPLRAHLHRAIVIECPAAEEDGGVTVLLEEGARWPYLTARRLDRPLASSTRQYITVGAAWVVARGRIIRDNIAKERAARRAARSR